MKRPIVSENEIWFPVFNAETDSADEKFVYVSRPSSHEERDRIWSFRPFGKSVPMHWGEQSFPGLFTNVSVEIRSDGIVFRFIIGPRNRCYEATLQTDVRRMHLLVSVRPYCLSAALPPPKKLGGDRPVICPICLDDMNPSDTVQALQTCKHVYHENCLNGWLSQDDRGCPECRAKVEWVNNSNTQLEETNRSDCRIS